MKTQLRLSPHTVTAKQTVIEVWDGDRFLATITGAGEAYYYCPKCRAETPPQSLYAVDKEGTVVPFIERAEYSEGPTHIRCDTAVELRQQAAGIRIISKHPMQVTSGGLHQPECITISITP